MAKISANGATKVAEARRLSTSAGDRPTEIVWVLCSDGRVLQKLAGLTGYAVRLRGYDLPRFRALCAANGFELR